MIMLCFCLLIIMLVELCCIVVRDVARRIFGVRR